MQLDPEEYIDVPEINRFVKKDEPKWPQLKKATYKNFPLNDVAPKEHEKYLYIEYRTY
jgi:hypothetical protein